MNFYFYFLPFLLDRSMGPQGRAQKKHPYVMCLWVLPTYPVSTSLEKHISPYNVAFLVLEFKRRKPLWAYWKKITGRRDVIPWKNNSHAEKKAITRLLQDGFGRTKLSYLYSCFWSLLQKKLASKRTNTEGSSHVLATCLLLTRACQGAQ